MRLPLAVLLLAVTFTAAAQSTARSRPAGTLPLDEVPPPPPITQATSVDDEAVVTRRTDDNGQVIEEYRVRGKLYMQKVTPRHGKTYVLMDHKGDGTFTRLEQSLDQQIRVPQWVLWEF